MYNKSKAKQTTTKKTNPCTGKKERKKMNNNAIVRKLQKISLRFMRREIAILSIDDNSKKGILWNSLRRERNKKYREIYNELLEKGIEPSSIPIFEL